MTQNKREQVFIEKLSTLFDIAYQDAIKIKKSERYKDENIAFLEDQGGPREMMMRGLDEKEIKKKYTRSIKRKRREEAMKEKEQSRHNDKTKMKY